MRSQGSRLDRCVCMARKAARKDDAAKIARFPGSNSLTETYTGEWLEGWQCHDAARPANN